MNLIFKYIIFSFTILCLHVSTFSQTLTSNPYSYFGLGFIDNAGFTESTGSGSAGIAMPSEGVLNPANPASYSSIDSLGFYLYVGVYGKYSKLSSANVSHNTFDSNLKYIAMGFRASKRWGCSIGVAPFSTRGYTVSSIFPTDGDVSEYAITSTGSGSITRAYVANSFKIIKGLSLGVNVSYLFGTLKNKEQVSYSSDVFNDISNSSTNYFKNLYLDFGMQYHFKIKNNSFYTGVTYSPSQNLKTSYDRLVENGTDTLYYLDKGSENFNIPTSIGFGLGMKINDKLKLMADCKIMYWSKSGYSYRKAKLSDSWQLNAGAEYINNNKTGRKYWDYVSYRAGFRYEKTYLSISKKDLHDMAFTIGLGFPVKRTTINVSYEFGLINTQAKASIQENYHRLCLGFALRDWWFQKRKFY